MSNPKTSKDGAAPENDDPKKDVIEDAVILDEPEAQADDQSKDQADDAASDPQDAEDKLNTEDSDEVEAAVQENPEAAEPSEPDATPEEDQGPAAESPVAPAAEAPKQRSSLKLVLGVAVSTAIGAGAALYFFPNGIKMQDDTLQQQIQADLAAQVQATEALEAKLANLSLPPDLTPELTTLQGNIDTIATRITMLSDQVAIFDQRVGDLEKRPIADNLAPEAIAAYERELKALQAAMAEQRAEVEAKLAESATLRAEAEANAQQAQARDALTALASAIDGGVPLTASLTDLDKAGIAVPAALQDQADGVPTLALLQAEFPDAARAALAAARQDSGDTGVVNFLRDQLGVRSLTPQEGEGADAVLSRAEAALRAGDMVVALEELKALPDAATTALAAWQTKATRRDAALDALSQLRQSVKTN